MSVSTVGIVKWFDNKKGYSFVSYDDTEGIFIHFTVIEEEGLKTSEENQVVEFEIIEGNRGTRAVHVKRGSVHTSESDTH